MKKTMLALVAGFAGLIGGAFDSYDEAISAGKSAIGKDDFTAAVTAFSDAVAKAEAPDKIVAAGFGLADAYQRAGEKEKAKEAWDKLAKNEKIDAASRAWALVHLGDNLRDENLLIEALGKYDEALKTEKLPVWLQYEAVHRKVNLLGPMKKFDEASAACKQLAAVPNLDKELKSGVGLLEASLLMQQEKFPEATAAFEKLLAQPDFTGQSGAYWGLANAYKNTGNIEKGIEICRKGVALNNGMKPDFEATLANLESQKK